MQEVSTTARTFPSTSSRDALTEVLRSGAQRLLAEAVEAEVHEWIDLHAHLTDAAGRRQVVRNGYLPKRSILTGMAYLIFSILTLITTVFLISLRLAVWITITMA